MTPDIIILAALALFILFRLHGVLGKRIGHEQKMRPARRRDDRGERVIQLPDPMQQRRREGTSLMENTDPKIARSVGEIQEIDPSFSLEGFIRGAKTAFEMVLESFGREDKKTLRNLLGDEVYAGFEAEINERKNADEKPETTLVALNSAEVVGVKVKKNIAQITVKFISEQINIVRDKLGEITSGNPSRIDKVVDVWTFERNVSDPDPNWRLVETQGEA